jgi:hypothetical protein
MSLCVDGEWLLMFGRIVVPSLSTLHALGLLDHEDEGTTILSNISNHSPSTQHHSTEVLNSQQHCCENLTPHTIHYLYRVIHIERNPVVYCELLDILCPPGFFSCIHLCHAV